jgi:predicted dehydrogenase
MIRFAVIGITHGHINGQVQCLLDAGATFVAWHAYTHESTLIDAFAKTFPQARQVQDEAAILEDPTIQMVVTSTVPADRAPLGIRVMQHGKDFMTDKPGFTTLAQLAEARKVQAATGRIYSVCYSERFENRATTYAAELARSGAIGKVLQTIGLGPHRGNLPTRLPYFFQRERYGGILCDIGSHQFDQFLYFTGSTQAEIVTSQVGNLAHPQHPGLEDFGDAVLRGDAGTGYLRVDWFTPDGLPVWGDGRLTVLGTEGYIEVRKYIDIAGRPGANHVFITDKKGTRYEKCDHIALPYGRNLVHDVLNRSETAMSQTHCFLASELALTAQAQATVLTAFGEQ